MHWAAFNGHLIVSKYLAEMGVDVNAKDIVSFNIDHSMNIYSLILDHIGRYNRLCGGEEEMHQGRGKKAMEIYLSAEAKMVLGNNSCCLFLVFLPGEF